MLIGVDKVNVGGARQELAMHGTPEFPCAAYTLELAQDRLDEIPVHWHEELEIQYVAGGEVEQRVPETRSYAQVGDCFCINSNVLHYTRPVEESRLRVLVFHPDLICGGADSVFARRYIRPLVENRSFGGLLLRGGEHPEAASAFLEAFRAMEGEEPGYEFVVRDRLSRLCLLMAGRFVDMDTENARVERDSASLKLMLDYIHRNINQAVRLRDIALAAGLGERKCERVFLRQLGMTPRQYVGRHRLAQAAAMLLARPDMNIQDVAAECGFTGSTVFSRAFSERYGLPPREYRARMSGDAERE